MICPYFLPTGDSCDCGWYHLWVGSPGLCKKAGRTSQGDQDSKQSSSMTSA